MVPSWCCSLLSLRATLIAGLVSSSFSCRAGPQQAGVHLGCLSLVPWCDTARRSDTGGMATNLNLCTHNLKPIS